MILRHDHMRTDPAYRAALRTVGLDSVAAIFGRIDGRVVAWSRTTDSIYVPGPDGVGFYVKRYWYPTWRHRLRTMLRGTFLGVHRGLAEYRSLTLMRHMGIASVRPVACGCRRLGHFVTACFLITEEVPDAPNLTTFAQQVQRGAVQLDRRERIALAERLATQLAEMHAQGFAHGRLFWRNVLVRRAVAGGPEFFLLDAEPPKRLERLGRGGRWWLWELAKLAVSAVPFTTRSERVRFLRAYFKLARLTPDAKSQLHELDRLTHRWRRHEAQRIRMNRRFDEWNRRLDVEERQLATAGGAELGG
jgi:hypothetical protein